MLKFLQIVVWAIIFYVIYKLAVSIMNMFKEDKSENVVSKKPKKSKLNIDQKDIIDAKFEDITSGDKEKSKDNN